MNVRILIESTWHGRAKKDGVAMWLIEYMRGDIPETRQGFIHARDQTEAAGCLMALINALTVLKKPCNIEITTQCEKLLNVLSNRWHTQWKERGWKTSKGKIVKDIDLWELLIGKMDPHTYTIESGPHDYQKIMQAAVVKEFEDWEKKGG